MNTGLRKILCCLLLISIHTLLTIVAHAQSYGLGFASHEVIQDKRTSLELLPGGDYCAQQDFELTFDITILPGRRDYFGYILRVIRNEQEHIDLIYDVQPGGNQFKLVIGGRFTNIAFVLDSLHLYHRWNQFRLRFDFQHDQIVLSNGTITQTQQKVGLKTGDCFKYYFGASQYRQAKITDVPPMKIRDVKIIKEGTVKYWWPLDEREGNSAHENKHDKDAAVINPVWIKNTHYEWRLVRQLTVRRAPGFAFNPKQGILYLIASDSLYNFSTLNNEVTATAYPSGQQPLLRGNQSLYDSSTGRLYTIYIDHHFVATYDFAHNDWDKKFQPGPVTDYWHFNKFYSPHDTSLYLLNGYGHFLYRDTIRRYHIPTATWSTVPVTGDKLLPRYLAAAGATAKGDGLYILGGYGSETGQQILAPKSYYDMLYFDARKHTLKKLFEIKPRKEDVVFANTLVIDEAANRYYGLTFPNYKYSSQLQLIQGSLDKADYALVGNTMPFSFRDVNSFADLYYCPLSRQLIAATSLQATNDKDGIYTINIYTLAAPPVGAGDTVSSNSPHLSWWIYLLITIIILSAGWGYYARRKNKRSVANNQLPMPAPPVEGTRQPAVNPSSPPATSNPQPVTGNLQPVTGNLQPVTAVPSTANAIYLFGEMQVVDQEGADITKQFTPLVRELFLIILLYTTRRNRGVSSEKLTEMLWSDKSAQSARNNRSVNIAKLKAILDKLPGCQLSNETGAWKIEIDYEKIYVDYYQYLRIVQDKTTLTRQKINDLAGITRRGGFLSHLEYAWLATFKADVSNDIIDTYLNFAGTISIADDPEFLIKLANDIFHFDPVNEDAMAIKCRALVHQGKHSLARTAFENFAKEYKTLYGEDFPRDFHSVLET